MNGIIDVDSASFLRSWYVRNKMPGAAPSRVSCIITCAPTCGECVFTKWQIIVIYKQSDTVNYSEQLHVNEIQMLSLTHTHTRYENKTILLRIGLNLLPYMASEWWKRNIICLNFSFDEVSPWRDTFFRSSPRIYSVRVNEWTNVKRG